MIRPVHDRMPVLLMPDEYDTWLNGSFDDLLAFQDRCFPDDLIEMQHTTQLWSTRNNPSSAEGDSRSVHRGCGISVVAAAVDLEPTAPSGRPLLLVNSCNLM